MRSYHLLYKILHWKRKAYNKFMKRKELLPLVEIYLKTQMCSDPDPKLTIRG